MPTNLYGPSTPTSSGSASGPAPARPKATPKQKALNAWAKRVPALRKMGYKQAQIGQAVKYDLNQVKKGDRHVSDAEALYLVHSVATLKDIMPHAGGIGGFVQNLGEDAGGIITSLPKLPGAVVETYKDLTATAQPYETKRKTQQFQQITAAKTKIAKGDVGGGIKDITRLPGPNLIPGSFTAGNVASGDWETIAKHPVSTALDVLPIASAAGKVWMAGKAFEPGSVGEAMAAGNVPKAAFRAALGSTTEPRSLAGAERIFSGEATRVPRSSDIVSAVATRNGLSREARQLIYAPVSVASRQLAHGINEIVAGHAALYEGLNEAEHAALKRAVEGIDSPASLPAHVRPIYAAIDDAAPAAIRDGVAAGKLTLVADPLTPGEYHAFNPDHVVARAYRKLNTALTKAVERANRWGADSEQAAAAVEKAARAKAQFTKIFARYPSRVWEPLVYNEAALGMKAMFELQHRAGLIDEATMSDYLTRLADGTFAPEKGSALDAAWRDEVKHVSQYWYHDFKGGVRPIYVPNASQDVISAIPNTRPIPDAVPVPTVYRLSHALTFRPGVANVAVQLAYRDVQILRSEISAALVEHFAQTFGHSPEQARAIEEILAARREIGARETFNTHVAGHLGNDWVSFNEEVGKYAGGNLRNPAPDDLLIHRSVAAALRKRLSEFDSTSPTLMRGLQKTTSGWRIAVTATPRHLAHVTASGMAYAAGEQGLGPFLRMREAWRMVTSGEYAGIPELGGHLGTGALSNEELRSVLDGEIAAHTLSAHLAQLPGLKQLAGAYGWWRNLEDHVGQAWKAASYLTEYDKQLARGVDLTAAKEAAIARANHIHMEFDSMTPLERTITRTVFPFYGFQRQILRYLFRYPGDHPLAASMIAKLALMERDDQASGLPASWGTYIGVGGGQFVDVRTFNPFRSLGEGRNPWSIAGFTSQLNPAARVPLEMIGVDTLSARVDQYLGSEVDPQTGGLVSKRAGSAWGILLQQYIPQSQLPVISNLLGSRSYLDSLSGNPDSYRRALTSILGVPFVPFSADEAQTRLKVQDAYFRAAQQDVSQAIRSGDLATLERYDLVPYAGTVVTPGYLERKVAAGQKAHPGTSAHDILYP